MTSLKIPKEQSCTIILYLIVLTGLVFHIGLQFIVIQFQVDLSMKQENNLIGIKSKTIKWKEYKQKQDPMNKKTIQKQDFI